MTITYTTQQMPVTLYYYSPGLMYIYIYIYIYIYTVKVKEHSQTTS